MEASLTPSSWAPVRAAEFIAGWGMKAMMPTKWIVAVNTEVTKFMMFSLGAQTLPSNSTGDHVAGWDIRGSFDRSASSCALRNERTGDAPVRRKPWNRVKNRADTSSSISHNVPTTPRAPAVRNDLARLDIPDT